MYVARALGIMDPTHRPEAGNAKLRAAKTDLFTSYSARDSQLPDTAQALDLRNSRTSRRETRDPAIASLA